MTTRDEKRFPNESSEYRAARDELLDLEMELRRATERVAEQRRSLPPGGRVKEDYAFIASGGGEVRLSDLFDDRDTLVLYGFMYGPRDSEPCPMCTSVLDGLNGNAPDITRRVSLVVTAKSPIERIEAFATRRGWSDLRLVSWGGSTYGTDYFAENEQGYQMPMLNVFTREDGDIRHFWGSELLYVPSDEGHDSRHVDMIWPLWNLLDTTPEGRGDFYPGLDYK